MKWVCDVYLKIELNWHSPFKSHISHEDENLSIDLCVRIWNQINFNNRIGLYQGMTPIHIDMVLSKANKNQDCYGYPECSINDGAIFPWLPMIHNNWECCQTPLFPHEIHKVSQYISRRNTQHISCKLPIIGISQHWVGYNYVGYIMGIRNQTSWVYPRLYMILHYIPIVSQCMPISYNHCDLQIFSCVIEYLVG